MLKNLKLILATLICIALVSSLCGCTKIEEQPVEKEKLLPQEVVTNFWNALDTGDYKDAYTLIYHQVEGMDEQSWIDEHEAWWGENGSNLKIFNFTVVGNYTLPENTFEGNFTEARSVTVNATVAYSGHVSSGISQFVVVNTSDGWKLYGNY
ncbi:hypothetical protein CUJ83_00245 [Methanocella sp. CWC-04]|uniref:Uncharacterized protein n=1 Tax=Methanooceanicella nereidis TaxID=2052831 RepID=A0AAP2W4H3_9EURY|nr:hypothetical protein [Methanocella sp. CWC-04]MCD1293428.1 hypothetical protein [Methanocella sp. CWC-04]